MIAEIIPEIYDAEGRKTFRPHERMKRKFNPTFPLGRFISQPLKKQCESLEEVHQFLSQCRGKSDNELFGQEDYWQPPEEFETRKEGDCEDFAIWTWRQLMGLGYRARLAGGRCGRYGDGHAWVQFEREGKWFLLEPQLRILGLRMPQLSILSYKPDVSFEWDGEKIHYFAHEPPGQLAPTRIIGLIPEWLTIWSRFWLRVLVQVPLLPYRIIKRRFTTRSSIDLKPSSDSKKKPAS